jgi:cytochrome P450
MSTPTDIRALLEWNQDAIRCPYDAYAQLRTQEPVHFVEGFGGTGVYVVSRYEDVSTVLRSSDFASQTPMGPPAPGMLEALGQVLGERPELADVLAQNAEMPTVLLLADGPDHGRHRRLVNRVFTAREVKRQEPMIRAVAEELIDGFIADGRVDLIAQFTHPFPVMIISDLIGMPRQENFTRFKRWADAFASVVGFKASADQLREILEVQLDYWEFMSAQIEDRRANPRDDILSRLVQATSDGDHPLTDPEVLAITAQLLAAGTESSGNVIASTMNRLSRDPDLLGRIRDEPALIGRTVEEMLRLESPLQSVFRNVMADVEVGGVPIPRGSIVMLVFGSANRDPEAFNAETELDLEREGNAHLAFGLGPHFCVGAALGRLEARIGLEVLLSRIDDIKPAGTGELDYAESYMVHSIASLPLTFRARERSEASAPAL